MAKPSNTCIYRHNTYSDDHTHFDIIGIWIIQVCVVEGCSVLPFITDQYLLDLPTTMTTNYAFYTLLDSPQRGKPPRPALECNVLERHKEDVNMLRFLYLRDKQKT